MGKLSLYARNRVISLQCSGVNIKIGPRGEHVSTSWFLLSILELIRSQREQGINR